MSAEPTEADADARLEFRAVVASGRRHGIRLERVFWRALKDLAASRGTSLGALVASVAADFPDVANLTSALRVAAMRTHLERADVGTQHAGTVEAILLAVPSAAFTLATNRRIMSMNAGFQALVRREFGAIAEGARQELRLTVDMPLETLVSRLRDTANTPVSTGFALGTADRRFRGRLTLILAPARDDLLLAFVVGA